MYRCCYVHGNHATPCAKMSSASGSATDTASTSVEYCKKAAMMFKASNSTNHSTSRYAI